MSNLIIQMIEAANRRSLDKGVLFEEVVKLAYQDILLPGDNVIDIGANVGFHLFPMARAVGRKGRVHAFEPLPHLLKILKKQTRRQLLFNIRFYQLALGMHNQKTSFKFFREEPGYSGLRRRLTPFTDQEGGLEEIVVQQSRLDNVLPDSTGISFIKIDIEGGELHALMGGRDLLAKSRPVIIFECGFQDTAEIYEYTTEDFFGFFDKLEYSVFSLGGDPFSKEDWHIHPCWELIALPVERAELSGRFPGYCEQALNKVGSG